MKKQWPGFVGVLRRFSRKERIASFLSSMSTARFWVPSPRLHMIDWSFVRGFMRRHSSRDDPWIESLLPCDGLPFKPALEFELALRSFPG